MSEEKETSKETEKFIWYDLPISNFIKTCFTYNLKQESMSHPIQISQINWKHILGTLNPLPFGPVGLFMLDKKSVNLCRGFLVSVSYSSELPRPWVSSGGDQLISPPFKSKCIQMEILPIIVQSAAIPVFF